MVVALYYIGRRVVDVALAYRGPSTLSHGGPVDSDVAFTYYPSVFSHEPIASVD